MENLGQPHFFEDEGGDSGMKEGVEGGALQIFSLSFVQFIGDFSSALGMWLAFEVPQ